MAPTAPDDRPRGPGAARWLIAGASVLLVLLVAALLAFALDRSRRHHIAEAQSLSDQLARSVEQHAHRTLLTVDATLAGLARSLEPQSRTEALDSVELRTRLQLFGEQVFAIGNIAVVDAAGSLVNSAGGRDRLQGQAGFAEFVAAARLDEGRALFIGRPLLDGRTGTGKMFMSRPFQTGSGANGLVIAEVAVEGFTDFYRSINSPRGTRIALVAADGTLIATEPPLAGAAGRPAGGPEVFGGGPAITSVRHLPGRPLLIAVSTDRDAALATWRSEARLYLALLLGVVAAAALAGAGLIRLAARRLQAERAQKEAQLRLTRGIDAMSDAFVLYDAEERVVLWNSKYLSFFPYLADVLRPGVHSEELLEHTIANAPLDLAPEERDAWRRWRRERHRNPGEPFEQIMADGRCFHTVVRRTPGGDTVVVIREISELKHAERAARHAKEAAEQANRTKSAFLANMSHELRTPLNAILGFSDIISSGLFGEHRRYMDYAGDINAAGHHLLRLVNDILDLSKIESGAMELREGEVDLDALAASCCELVRPRALEAGVRLSAEAEAKLPTVHADELRLKQVLLNLLSNAIKFTPRGGAIAVSVARGDGGAVLSVGDTGIGMQQEEIAIALQDFGQVDSSLSRRFEGSGLGLPLSRRLVELHGGTLEIETEFGKGTTVRVRLPAWRTQEIRRTA